MFSSTRSAFITIFLLLLSLSSIASPNETIELVVLRSKHTLIVKKGDIVLRSFKVAFGSGGRKAKLREGDHTTPKGIYVIKKKLDSERFHLFLQLNYPNVDDAKRAFKNHIITQKEYRAIILAQSEGRMPPQNTALGGTIGIHGIGDETKEKLEIHQFIDWTKGCIAMRNDEVDVLSQFIEGDTKVTITD